MKKKEKNSFKNRAWIELNLDNLEHNINEIKKIIPKDTNIMAVLKANAYGHGSMEIAEKLSSLGIIDFAVATLQEGIELRKQGLKGNILILGYTDFDYLDDVIKYDLQQTIVDYSYAKHIEKLMLTKKIKAHVKVNTGMNRIGEDAQNLDHFKKIYQMNCFDIIGIYTHLSVADSKEEEDIRFTKQQIDDFYKVINFLKEAGYKPGYTHIQSSYGILNYLNLTCDYIRLGLLMYGVYNDKADKNLFAKKVQLKPVLSLKARVTSVRKLEPGKSVSYGRKFITKKPTKIASVAIGYADGYPRNLSLKNAAVLVGRKYAPIIGRICMDQLMIDVSSIKKIKPGDVVSLIGEKDQISIEQLSYLSDSISHELLSRLGIRLDRVIVK